MTYWTDPYLITTNHSIQTFVSLYCITLQETDRPSFSLICCHCRRHPSGTDCTVLWLIHYDMLHSFVCQNKARCHIPQVYWSVCLSEFLDAWSVDFCHWGIFLSLPDANVEHHLADLFLDIISPTYPNCQHQLPIIPTPLCTHTQHTHPARNSWISKQDQSSEWVTMLNCCSCARSAHMQQITWLNTGALCWVCEQHCVICNFGSHF